MQNASSSPILDPARLAALDGYLFLDTAPEDGFDDIVRLVTTRAAEQAVLLELSEP